MKTLKHIFAFALTFALLFVLATPAFATGSIEVLDPGTATYTAYKIFDVTDDNSGNLTYTAVDPWKAAIEDALANGDLSGLAIDATSGEVTKLANFKAADFAAWAKDHIPTGETGTALAVDQTTGKTIASGLDDGYYLVVPSIGNRASLCTVIGNDVTVQNKNDMPFDKKAEGDTSGVYDADETNVQLGDTVNFQIAGKVPDVSGSDSYFYLVSDTLSAGLTPNNDVVVTVDGTAVALTVVTDPNAELTGNQIRYRADGFDLSLDMMVATYSEGDAIAITYSAVVNENAINVVSTNFATLDYGDQNEQHHKDSETKHYTSKIVIDKYETGSPESKVAGAEFVLQNDQDDYYVYDAATKTVSWDADINNATKVTTDAEGAAEFIGLPDGDYTITETAAPAGYTQLTDPIPVTVDGSAATAVGLTEAQITVALSEFLHVANTPGTLLPSTGGIGTTIFYIGGGLLVLAAVVVILIASRKKQAKSN